MGTPGSPDQEQRRSGETWIHPQCCLSYRMPCAWRRVGIHANPRSPRGNAKALMDWKRVVTPAKFTQVRNQYKYTKYTTYTTRYQRKKKKLCDNGKPNHFLVLGCHVASRTRHEQRVHEFSHLCRAEVLVYVISFRTEQDRILFVRSAGAVLKVPRKI